MVPGTWYIHLLVVRSSIGRAIADWSFSIGGLPAAAAKVGRVSRSTAGRRRGRRAERGGCGVGHLHGGPPEPPDDDGRSLRQLPFPKAIRQDRRPPEALSGT